MLNEEMQNQAPSFFRRGKLLFVILLGFPNFCFAQVSHLDSALAIQLAAELSHQAAGKPFAVAADSGFQSFIGAMPHGAGSAEVAQLRGFSATVAGKDFTDASDGKVTPVLVNVEGNWLDDGNPLPRQWSVEHTFAVSLSPADRTLLETNRDRYVTLERVAPTTFWSGIAEPAIVVLGAIAIVALFFLIRS